MADRFDEALVACNAVYDIDSKNAAFNNIKSLFWDKYRIDLLNYQGCRDQHINMAGENVQDIDVFYARQRYITNSIRLRNEVNKYLEVNKDDMTSVEYQAVLKAYEDLKIVCDEHMKDYGPKEIFKAYKDQLDMELSYPEKGEEIASADIFAKKIATKFYLSKLEREYEQAVKMEAEGDENQKTEAAKWKEDVLAELYSGHFEENVDKFIKEDIVGKTVYETFQKKFDPKYHSEGMDHKDIESQYDLISLNLTLYANNKLSKLIKLPTKESDTLTKEEADKNKKECLDIIYEVEHICEVTKRENSHCAVKYDTHEYKVDKELFGPFVDKLTPLYQKLAKEYEDKVNKDLSKELAEMQVKVNQAKSEWREADSEFKKREKEFNSAKAKFARAKITYEKMKMATEMDSGEKQDVETYIKFEKDKYNIADTFFGRAATKASAASRKLEALEKQLEQMNQRHEMLRKKAHEENPYLPKDTNHLIVRGTHEHQIIESKDLQGNVKQMDVIVPKTALQVKVDRNTQIMKLFTNAQINGGEYAELTNAEEENYKLLSKAENPMDLKRTVSGAPEPAIEALFIRDQQLQRAQEEVKEEAKEEVKEEVKPEVENVEEAEEVVRNRSNSVNINYRNPIKMEDEPEENQPDNEPEAEPEEDIDYSSIQILKDETERVKALKDEEPKENISYSDAHTNLVSLNIVLKAVVEADKRVFTGSKEYDDILKNLGLIQAMEESINNKALASGDDSVKADRMSLLKMKKLMNVQMKHYLNRKNEERQKALDRNKKENKTSKRRRETIETAQENIKAYINASETVFGMLGKDKFYEDLALEVMYLELKYPKVKGLKDVLKKVNDFDAKYDSMTIDERLTEQRNICVDMARLAEKTKSTKFTKDMMKVFTTLGNKNLQDVAEYHPEELNSLKEKYGKINASMGSNVDMDIQKVQKNAQSYNDIQEEQDIIRADYAKYIYRKEAEKKQTYEKWAMDADGFEFKLDDDEKQYRNKIVSSAYKSIFADLQKSKKIIFNEKDFRKDSKNFVENLAKNKEFTKAFGNNLCSVFDLKDKDVKKYKVTDIDLSPDRIKQVKNDTFKKMLVDKITALGTNVKDKSSNDIIQNGLQELNDMKDLAKLIGTEKAYESKVQVDNKNVTIKELEDIVKAKANKALEPVKAQNKKQNNKQPVKPQTGMKK